MQIIFQDPFASLDPRKRVLNIIGQGLKIHTNLKKNEIKETVLNLLEQVDLQAEHLTRYPHEFSGGMRQRVMIAISLLCNPKIIIADEPTTSLDVTVQAQIMELFKDIQKEFQTSFILITHNMGIVADTCLKTLVLYGGKVMEYGLTTDVFLKPTHPYTIGLLETMPRIDREYDVLKTIPGNPPNMLNLPEGCPFSNRCQYKINDCSELQPSINTINNQNQQRACHVLPKEFNL